jgi:hypothetical protein
MHNQYENTKQYWENEMFICVWCLFPFADHFAINIIHISYPSYSVFGDCLWLAKSTGPIHYRFLPRNFRGNGKKNSIHTKTLAVRIRMYFHFGKESIEDRAQNQLFLFCLESHTICCKRVNSKTNMHDPHHLGSPFL